MPHMRPKARQKALLHNAGMTSIILVVRSNEGIADSHTHAEDAAVGEYDTTFDEAQSQRSQGLKDIRCP